VSDVPLLLEVLAFCKEPRSFVGCCGSLWHVVYKECASKPLVRAAFRIEPDEPFQHLSFHDFQDQLSAQGLGYLPVQKHYQGYSTLRAVTRLTISQQKRLYKNKHEGARKPGRPKKDKEEQDKNKKDGAKRYKVKSRSCRRQ
jgi:hypothetical protein